MPRFAKFAFAAAAIIVLMPAGSVIAQQSPPEVQTRKVTTRIPPDYPELAKRMHIAGVVKVEAVVRPNGTVKSTRVVGGNPVLVDAAQVAIGKWKFEPAQNETTEVVQLSFARQ
jgi:TonB family protein